MSAVDLNIARCPHCGAGFPLTVGAPAELVTCPSCGAESERAKLVVIVKAPAAALAPRTKPSIQRPKMEPPQALEVATRAGLLTVGWHSAPGGLASTFALFGWGGLMALMLILQAVIHQDWPVIFGAVSLPAMLVYIAIAGAMNRTEIEAGEGRFHINVGPLPWFGGSKYSSAQFAQFYVTETFTQDKDDNPVAIYALKARLKTGVHVTLLDGLTSESHALYLEQVIEQHLGIVDAAVPHEMMR